MLTLPLSQYTYSLLLFTSLTHKYSYLQTITHCYHPTTLTAYTRPKPTTVTYIPHPTTLTNTRPLILALTLSHTLTHSSLPYLFHIHSHTLTHSSPPYHSHILSPTTQSLPTTLTYIHPAIITLPFLYTYPLILTLPLSQYSN